MIFEVEVREEVGFVRRRVRSSAERVKVEHHEDNFRLSLLNFDVSRESFKLHTISKDEVGSNLGSRTKKAAQRQGKIFEIRYTVAKSLGWMELGVRKEFVG